MIKAIAIAVALVLAYALLPKPSAFAKTSKRYEECDMCGNLYESGFLVKKRCEICVSYDKWVNDTKTDQSYRAFQVRGYPFCVTCGVRKKYVLPLSEEATLQAYPDGFTCCKCEYTYNPPMRKQEK